MSDCIRVMLIEDNREYREAIEFAIEGASGMQVIASFVSAELALKSMESVVTNFVPDVLLLDLNLPGISGLDAIPYFKGFFADAKIIILSQSENEADVLCGITLGASGYLLKSSTISQIKDSIRAVFEGGYSIDASVAKYIIKTLKAKPLKAIASRLLSSRESEVLELLAEGLQKKEIAECLKISTLTVDSHVRRIYEKLDAKNAPAAVSKAYQVGIL